MKKTLEKLWNEYLSDECSMLGSEEEKELASRAANKHKAVSDLLTAEQSYAVEEYADALCEINSIFAKKAFFEGCKFATLFLVESALSDDKYSSR